MNETEIDRRLAKLEERAHGLEMAGSDYTHLDWTDDEVRRWKPIPPNASAADRGLYEVGVRMELMVHVNPTIIPPETVASWSETLRAFHAKCVDRWNQGGLPSWRADREGSNLPGPGEGIRMDRLRKEAT